MNRDQTGKRFRESDSSEENQLGRFGGVNRFGEERIRHDSIRMINIEMIMIRLSE